MYQDSAGRPIGVGSRVRFRGEEYTIKAFHDDKGPLGEAAIEFEEPEVHTPEMPTEISVDIIQGDR